MAMQIEMHLDGRRALLSCSGELTIYEAAELQQALLASLAESDSIDLDLAAVSELDTAGFQQLLLLQREALAVAKPMRIRAHSAATREVFDLLCADALFQEAS